MKRFSVVCPPKSDHKQPGNISSGGMTEEKVLADFPDLASEDILLILSMEGNSI